MDETTTPTLEAPAAEPRRLVRSRDGRWLGGVAAGLGAYFDVNPAIYRLAFAALALAGGTGILLYAAAWLVIPDEGAEDSIAATALRRHRDQPWLIFGIGLLGFAGLVALSEARVWPSPGNLWLAAAIAGAAIVWWQLGTREPAAAAPGEATPGVVTTPGTTTPRAAAPRPPRRASLLAPAVGVLILVLGLLGLLEATDVVAVDWTIALAACAVVLGALVAAGAAMGRAVGSVAVLGLAVLAALALSLAVHVPLFAGVGDRLEHPASVTALHSRYELGIGNLTVDLGDVRFPAGETHVKATLGIGHVEVTVPRNVSVIVDGRAQAGQVRLLGRDVDGTHVHDTVFDRTGTGRVLVLDARVGLGEVTVKRG